MLYSFLVKRADVIQVGGVVAESADEALKKAQKAFGAIGAVTLHPWADGAFCVTVDRTPEKTEKP